MARKWSARLLVLGGLTLAIGCKCHSKVPLCTTPLYPETVMAGPGGPPMPMGSPFSPDMPLVTTGPAAGAQLPKPGSLTPGVFPPQFARVPTGKTPPSRPVDRGTAKDDPDVPSILPPKDVAGTLTGRTKAVEPPAGPAILPAPKPLDGSAPAVSPPTSTDIVPFSPASKIVAPPLTPAVGTSSDETRPLAAATPLKPGEKFGHARDYRWVAGVLDRHLRGGYWTLRYADLSADDPWGGKVRLLDDRRLNEFKSGDVVYVEGELLAPRTAAAAEGTANYPPFRVTNVNLVERAK
jgi:hypothetical protein